MHEGATGVQTVAPSSINAWLNAPGRSGETSRSAISEIRLRTVPVVVFSRIRNRRAITRVTFPSTAGTGIPKAMLATAPAGYGPLPGRGARPPYQRGDSPRWRL